MHRADRLFRLIQILRDGRIHRARDLARELEASPRTIYRDMAALAESGVPVEGSRGAGYRLLRRMTTLPPLTLAEEELEALNLGIAIVAQSPDPDLRAAATLLADKIDEALATQAAPAGAAWRARPGDAAGALRHMPMLRAAIRGRQKLRLTLTGGAEAHVVRPLCLENWGRLWVLTAWCESHARFAELRTDRIEEAHALPELFVDEPGKRLADFHATRN